MDQAVRAVRALPQARRRAVAGGQGRSAAAAAVPDHPRRQQTADHAQGIRRPDGRQPERDLLHRGRRLPQRAAQPHLEPFSKRGIEVLILSDPVDPILLTNLSEFEGKKLRSVDDAELDLTDVGTPAEDEEAAPEPVAEADFETVRNRFAELLGERVKGVRASKTLAGAPARLVSDDNSADAQMFRVNRLLSRDYSLPVKTLELNPRHPLLHNLARHIAAGGDEVVDLVIEQVFETALLQDGIHPDPASMAERLTKLMQKATE
ncbi:MAG: hypothetical protein IPM16_19900 [Chloroflexi bacterium]|nr:hypothetical protein [Chloroflexota bacterium]